MSQSEAANHPSILPASESSNELREEDLSQISGGRILPKQKNVENPVGQMRDYGQE